MMIVLLIPMTTVFASLGDNIVTYEITLENLTDGQIFSPPIFITHQQRYTLFQPFRRASKELRSIIPRIVFRSCEATAPCRVGLATSQLFTSSLMTIIRTPIVDP